MYLHINNKMKINFDQLFKAERPLAFSKGQISELLLLDQPRKNTQIGLNQSKTLDATPKTINRSNTKDYQSIKQTLQFNLEAALRQELKTVNKTPIFLKKKKKVDISQLTQRVYNCPPCSRKQCKQFQIEKNNKQLQQNKWIEPRPKKNRDTKILNSSQNQATVHQRLFNNSKIAEIKRYQNIRKAHQEYKQQNRHTNFEQPSQYLQSYVPFYKRLASIVSKSQQKRRFLQQNPQLSHNSSKKYFTPSLISNRYYDVQSKYSREASPRQDYSLQQINCKSSLDTSFQTIVSLDKSIELINNVQKYFFNRMHCIFVNKEDNAVSITEQNIKLLSDIQFKIMQGFIVYLQQYPIAAQQFLQQLETYYQRLNFRDRQELRLHQTKLKKYAKQLQRQRQSIKAGRISQTKLLDPQKPAKKHSRNPNRYYQKIQSFV